VTSWQGIIDPEKSGIRPGPPAADRQLEAVEATLGVRIPSELRDLYRYADGLFDEPGQWFVVWPLARVGSDNLALRSGSGLPESLLAFGDDGTGDPFCIDLGSLDPGAVKLFSCVDGEARPLAPDLQTFWRDWQRGVAGT
jgi:hypothetical protein